jgi:hypothetical protein
MTNRPPFVSMEPLAANMLDGSRTSPRWELVEGTELEDFPWEQWPGEPSLWYGRFRTYLELGFGRNMGLAYRRHPDDGSPFQTYQTWLDKARLWAWWDRAKAWDVHVVQSREAEEDAERLLARAQRRALINVAALKLEDAVEALPNYITWRTAIEGIKVITERSQSEHNDLPTQRAEGTIAVNLTQQIAMLFAKVFVEVNTIQDPTERQEAFASKLTEVIEAVTAA